MSTDTIAATDKDRRTLTEVVCDLTVVEHRLRDLRRWTPPGTTSHLDAALASIATALDSIHAEHTARTTVAVTVRIQNVYVGGREVTRTTTTTLPAPPSDTAGREAWAFDHLYPLTGTGDATGTGAGYFVTVLDASDPTLVGAEFGWGV